jgi:hypothetical protein
MARLSDSIPAVYVPGDNDVGISYFLSNLIYIEFILYVVGKIPSSQSLGDNYYD